MAEITLGTAKLATTLVGATVKAMSDAYHNRVNKRVLLFLSSIDTAYETASCKGIGQLQEYIESDIGQEILANYAEVITKTSSKRAQMVMALLFCNDPDLYLDEVEKIILIKALESIDDPTIDFFLECTKHADSLVSETPYARISINENNAQRYDVNGWGHEGISVFTNELIQRRLLLPDPLIGAFSSEKEGKWAVPFGVSSRSIKFARAFKKAQALIDANK